MKSTPLHIVHTEASCGWGGQEIRILTEAQGMLRRGHQITLLCPSESAIFSAASAYGVPVKALPIGRKNFTGLWAIFGWLKENSKTVSIINTHSSTDSWLVALAQKASRDVVPVIRTRHVSSPINKKRSTFWLYQKAVKHVIVTGEPLRHGLVQHNGFALDSMTSVPTGIALDRFYPRDKAYCVQALGLSTSHQYIGILATLRDWKGHTDLFHAFARFSAQYPTLNLLVVGDGPYLPTLQRVVNDLKLTDRIIFVGQQTNPEIWLNAMEVFVLPSYGDEGVSQAVMQAMACARPVVTTPIGGMTDAVTHQVNGLFVKPRDVMGLSAAIQSCLDQPVYAATLARAAQIKAQEAFGFAKMIDAMETIFQRYAKPTSTAIMDQICVG